MITFGKVSLERHISNNYAFDLKKLHSKFPGDCPKDFAKIALHCIAYDAEDRPSMSEVAEGLAKIFKKLSQQYKLPQVPDAICIDVELARKRREKGNNAPEEVSSPVMVPEKRASAEGESASPAPKTSKNTIISSKEGVRIMSLDGKSSILVDPEIFNSEKSPHKHEASRKMFSGVEKKTYIKVTATVVSRHVVSKSTIALQLHISNKTIKTIEQLDVLLKDSEGRKIDQVANIAPTRMPVTGWDAFPVFYNLPAFRARVHSHSHSTDQRKLLQGDSVHFASAYPPHCCGGGTGVQAQPSPRFWLSSRARAYQGLCGHPKNTYRRSRIFQETVHSNDPFL